jgi:hypothetical protein
MDIFAITLLIVPRVLPIIMLGIILFFTFRWRISGNPLRISLIVAWTVMIGSIMYYLVAISQSTSSTAAIGYLFLTAYSARNTLIAFLITWLTALLVRLTCRLLKKKLSKKTVYNLS